MSIVFIIETFSLIYSNMDHSISCVFFVAAVTCPTTPTFVVVWFRYWQSDKVPQTTPKTLYFLCNILLLYTTNSGHYHHHHRYFFLLMTWSYYVQRGYCSHKTTELILFNGSASWIYQIFHKDLLVCLDKILHKVDKMSLLSW